MIHEVVANKPFEILKANFYAVGKKLPRGMVVNYAIGRPATDRTVTDDMTAGICENQKLIVDQTTAVIIWQPRTEVTGLSLASPDEEITSHIPINQESSLSRYVKTKQNPAQRQ